MTTRDWYEKTYTVDGVTRWKTNGHIPFDPMLQKFVEAGYDVDINKCARIRAQEVNQSLQEYRKSQENHSLSEEDMFEMQSAFGKGVTVVNILTGKQYKL